MQLGVDGAFAVVQAMVKRSRSDEWYERHRQHCIIVTITITAITITIVTITITITTTTITVAITTTVTLVVIINLPSLSLGTSDSIIRVSASHPTPLKL